MAARRKSRKKSFTRRAATTVRRAVRRVSRRRRSAPSAGGGSPVVRRRRFGRRGGGNLPAFTTKEMLKTIAIAAPVGVGTAFTQDLLATGLGKLLTPKVPTGNSLGEKINGVGYVRPLVKLGIGTALAAIVAGLFKQRKIAGMMLIGSATEAGLSALAVMRANRASNGGATAAAVQRAQMAMNANPNRAALPAPVTVGGYAGGQVVAGLNGFVGSTNPENTL